MSVKWIVPWYEMLAFEIMLGIAVAAAVVNAWAQLKMTRHLKELLEAFMGVEP